MRKKTAVPNKVRFGIAVMRFIWFLVSAPKTVRQKHFMLRKWQHRQVAPLAIQTPTDGGLCIGCAVLPAQRENPPRPPQSRAYARGIKMSYYLFKQLSRRIPIILRLRRPKLRIMTTCRHKHIVTSTLYDLTVIHNSYLIAETAA